MQLRGILDIGTDGTAGKERHQIRLINLLTIITVSVSSAYLLFYILIQASLPILINSIVILLYLLTTVFIKTKRNSLARIWIFIIFMAHLFILTTAVFTKETGFHFYYFAIPPALFLVFDYDKMTEKLALSILALILFYVCELTRLHLPFITLSASVNRALYLSSILTIFIGIAIVVFIFAHDIRRNEDEQTRLIAELRKNLQEIKTLKGFLPICSVCKKIRDDKGYWNQIEAYIQSHSEAEFSHSLCQDCAKTLYPDLDFED